jgi:hypothetical protein
MLTAERLREVIDYDPERGVLIWKKSGNVAGYVGKEGYRNVCVDGRMYREHRLAWLHATGSWPKQSLDHINGSRADNRLTNLREASGMQNAKNMKRPVTNTSGLKGASWHKRSGKWQAAIMCDRKLKHLGLFETAEEAHAAYCEAASRLHGDFACLDR